MRLVSGWVALAVALALLVVAFAIPVFRYDDVAGADREAERYVRREAGRMTKYDGLLFSQLRALESGGPEGTSGVVSYRTIFGVETFRYEVDNDTTRALLDRPWVAIWLWVALAGAEIALIAYAVWRLAER